MKFAIGDTVRTTEVIANNQYVKILAGAEGEVVKSEDLTGQYGPGGECYVVRFDGVIEAVIYEDKLEAVP